MFEKNIENYPSIKLTCVKFPSSAVTTQSSIGSARKMRAPAIRITNPQRSPKSSGGKSKKQD